jgi:DNA invertase Pin-like site-specific DNA recombinase
MIKGVSYLRVSKHEKSQRGFGLIAQRMANEAYAKANQIEIINEFIEIESAIIDDRPKLEKSLRCCKWHDATLLIAKIDRLTRDLHFLTTLEKNKVKFVAVDNPNASSLVLHILVSVAQYEREINSTRTKEALRAAKSMGVELGTYGKYVLSVRNKRRATIFALRLRPLVNELISLGYKSVRKLAAELNRRAVPTFRPGGKWHKTTVINLLDRLKTKTAENSALGSGDFTQSSNQPILI